MVQRVDHGQEFPERAPVAQGREGHRRPDRRVSVLPAVLSHPGDVAFDVAGIQIRLVKRRIQELDERLLPANEALIHCFHGQARPRRISRTG